MARGEGSDPALDDRRGRDLRRDSRLRPPARPHQPRDMLHPAAAPACALAAVPARSAALVGRRDLRPRLPSPAHAPARTGNRARAPRRAATDRDRRLRPRPSAVGVHAHRRSQRRRRHGARGLRDEGAPLGDRRRRRHGVARASRRPHGRRGRTDRRRARDPRAGADGRARTGSRLARALLAPDARRHAPDPGHRPRRLGSFARSGRQRARTRTHRDLDRPRARAGHRTDVAGHAHRGLGRRLDFFDLSARRHPARRQGHRKAASTTCSSHRSWAG